MYTKNKIMTAFLLSSAVTFMAFAAGENQGTQPSEIRPVIELNKPSYSEACAEEKRDFLWEQITESEYKPLPKLSKPKTLGQLTALWRVFREGNSAFDNDKDVRFSSQPKPIHAEGTVGLVRLEPAESDHPFTGLYAQNSIGLLRLSSVTSPGPDQTGEFDPSIALKFFVDGQPSRNLHTAPKGIVNPAYNAFSVEMSTKIDLSKQSQFVQLFFNQILTRVNNPSDRISPASLSKVCKNGETIEQPVAPEVVTFLPTDAARGFGNNNTYKDFRADLGESMIEGTHLYDVYGKYENNEYYIGKIFLESRFKASAFGDLQLFFQHNR